MKIKKIIEKCKENPKIYCAYLLFKSIGDKEMCQRIYETQKNPYSIVIRRYGDKLPDKIIYEIYFNEDYRLNGFCSLYKFVLAHLAFAEDLGFTPVVYWGEKTLYFDDSVKSTNNCFEYFFMPVSEISHNEIHKYKNVVISKLVDRFTFLSPKGYKEDKENEIKVLAYYAKKYIHLREDVKLSFWNQLLTITGQGNTLGVHVRATDFNIGYDRHPVAISPQEYLQKTKEIYKKGNFDRIFLATDDSTVISLFKDEFGTALSYYEDTCRSVTGEAVHYGNEKIQRENHRYLLGIEIIRDFYTLGYCAGLVAGKSNVSMCARIIASGREQNYRELCIIDKGVNHSRKKTKKIKV